MALTKLYRKNIDVNCVWPGKMRRLTGKNAASTALNRRKVALAALNCRDSGGNGVESEKWRR